MLFNLKCASHLYKVAVSMDILWNIVCICELIPGVI